ncbi:MBL fold hydrolase [Bordetella bronchiseptica]|uniref:N-acyl homoserine lactonase family protein n=1 Tax=Bordetella bronchiseptica TaxID=518 RepID=UPI00049ED891|nr:N-acyl homoserine lactonase family protein [Bordetella bronchiseptica]AZW11452.1 MBL fold hydrolase [Bordetella bronchiseptica]KDC66205.1 metallo-beta-lactamase domain protein [Bordetella bronchiseptica MBORD624]KDD60985.1 metallo-beta-lactamase domain protein [Bordetella bronchiseptica SO10328]QBS68042.1 MBL fold hydrolase [Bordetella bronchiseptica]
MNDNYEVFAIKYATYQQRRRNENFLPADEHDAGLMPLDYYVWLLKSPARTILVDTGFNPPEAAARNREQSRCPIEALRLLDVAPDDIDDVIITHLHYDHAGNLEKIPRARFHIQDKEVEFATGRCMCHAPLRFAYSPADVSNFIHKLYAGRVVFHDGTGVVAPGVEVLHVGGHTKGLQAVRVMTQRGWVVLASDASHFYENLEAARPFPLVADVAEMLDGFERLVRAAGSPSHVVPGHDPAVMTRYPTHPRDPQGIALLHLPTLA